MSNIYFEGQVLWADVDANMHLRHSAYADYAAQARLNFLEKAGLPFEVLKEIKIGPILFREELLYRREVPLNAKVAVTCELVKGRADGSRWSIRHHVLREDGETAAIINVDGAWLDLQKRKLGNIPDKYQEKFMNLSRSDDFEVI